MAENLYTPNCIRTISGRYVNILEPTADMIDIHDIAHGLSRQYRFGGHTKYPYSVLRHSLYVSLHSENQLAGLLHDASEAYIGDIPSPLKKLLPEYQLIENRLMQVIADKYRFTYPLPEDVKQADKNELEQEWELFVLKKRGDTMVPEQAILAAFLDKFHKLTNNQYTNTLSA